MVRTTWFAGLPFSRSTPPLRRHSTPASTCRTCDGHRLRNRNTATVVEVQKLRIHDHMTPKATQEELQAASYAALRAHPTSEQAKALVAKLSSMVEEHTIRAGSRQRKRRGTASKLEYATGALLADLLRPLDAEEPNGWVYRSLQKTSFTGPVKWRAFLQLIDGLKGLALLQHVP